uniref:Uncharacterized protein n=1 Tax=Eutreptiella gymnastica TaxID=73025 RepID=A0A7S4CYI4_9EUGL|mmetsp:Transcript_40121/g.66877  ORF Transcript_40121/g.66877 Transcript_40121/m.66877 type:complete len:203 (+) Transcript_40121:221-829(+)|eukprot:CAMPEP_0174318430 /NCGR_PEP_ID=MMETSP0810-20121108/8209_1 /TAXON_ID=73025 ORGANISM="Eutreptiella gymnastica-like, Strain CCMP1594" /NCGR_SAMPLE_ID=MMETSP0810 /ASSEMBLY_ACC=CAM_ASM_000659 /LENGTH=202 /DNA_ID=CAMNT_0015428669 /DNA_START=590 /DNA_END=1198 /DNA_ORIENTATION=-
MAGSQPPRPGGSLGYCTCAQAANSTKSADGKWPVSGLEDHKYLSVTKDATRTQPAGGAPTSWQRPCSGPQRVALAEHGHRKLPYNATEFTQVEPSPPPGGGEAAGPPVLSNGEDTSSVHTTPWGLPTLSVNEGTIALCQGNEPSSDGYICQVLLQTLNRRRGDEGGWMGVVDAVVQSAPRRAPWEESQGPCVPGGPKVVNKA